MAENVGLTAALEEFQAAQRAQAAARERLTAAQANLVATSDCLDAARQKLVAADPEATTPWAAARKKLAAARETLAQAEKDLTAAHRAKPFSKDAVEADQVRIAAAVEQEVTARADFIEADLELMMLRDQVRQAEQTNRFAGLVSAVVNPETLLAQPEQVALVRALLAPEQGDDLPLAAIKAELLLSSSELASLRQQAAFQAYMATVKELGLAFQRAFPPSGAVFE